MFLLKINYIGPILIINIKKKITKDILSKFNSLPIIS